LFNKTVAWVFVGWVGLFSSAYIAMTVIPNVFLNCPYRTPFSALIWRVSHMLTILALVLTDTLVVGLHALLFSVSGQSTSGVSESIKSLMSREKLAKQITAHTHKFKEGLRRCVVSSAIDSSKISSLAFQDFSTLASSLKRLLLCSVSWIPLQVVTTRCFMCAFMAS
jgi:hypothetical protein